MATGGRLTRSKINASDELIDFACSPCTKKSKISEGVKFCVECQEYLCTSCVESHNSFTALSGHSLLGRSQLGTPGGTGARNLPTVPTDRCKVHITKLVDMYCGNHDVVGCSVCFNINHKTCGDIHYVPEYVQKRKPSSQMTNLQSQVNAIVLEMENLVKQHKQSKDDLKTKKAICLQEIQGFRTEINKAIDRLEQVTIKDLNDQFQALDLMCENETKIIQKTLDDLRKHGLSAKGSDVNLSQQFVSTKQYQADVLEVEQLIAGSLHVENSCLKFESHSKILDFLRSLYSLDHRQHQPIERHVVTKRKNETLYNVKSKETFNVKLSDDDEICQVWSMCLLDSGDILMSDHNNKHLKLLDGNTHIIKDSLKLSSETTAVCKGNAEEAIVGLENRSLQFVSVQGRLTPTRTLHMNHTCLGVCVISAYIFVTDGKNKNIFKYDMKGKRLKTIECSTIFTWNRFIVGCDDGKSLCVTDSNKGLIKMDLDGNVKWRYSEDILKGAYDLCSSGLGDIFVAGNESSNVMQVTLFGRCPGEVVKANVCCKEQRGVCFDRRKSKLIVSGEHSDYIYIYSLK